MAASAPPSSVRALLAEARIKEAFIPLVLEHLDDDDPDELQDLDCSIIQQIHRRMEDTGAKQVQCNRMKRILLPYLHPAVARRVHEEFIGDLDTTVDERDGITSQADDTRGESRAEVRGHHDRARLRGAGPCQTRRDSSE